jgi:hypothetical protein
MPEAKHRGRRITGALLAGALASAIVLAGVLIWFVPYLRRHNESVAEAPTPAAVFAVSEFPVPPHGRACMLYVTVDPESRLAEFRLRPAKPRVAALGPPVELVLSAPGYRGAVKVPGGYGGGSVALPLTPRPTHELITTACFYNLGRSSVLLDGTDETRTLSRSTTELDGKPVPGDVALTFLDNRPRSLLSRLPEVFAHASNLTDGLVPVWLIWLIAVLVALAVPGGVVAAFYVAMREDESSGLL